MSRLFNGSCERFFHRPTGLNAIEQRSIADPYLIGPFPHCVSLALVLKNKVATSIVCLFGICRPSAIVRRIAQIVVDAIYAVLCPRTRPHIYHELLKVVTPLMTNANATSAILIKVALVRIFAARYHRLPNSIFARAAGAMRPSRSPQLFSMQTPTTSRGSVPQIAARRNYVIPALAPTKPSCPPLLSGTDIAKYRKATKKLAGQIIDLFIGNGDDLRQSLRGYMFGVHQKSPFCCHVLGHSQCRQDTFIGLLPLHYSRFSRVMEGTP